jgi:hypothetical protein
LIGELTILASLVLIVSQGTVESSQLTELVPLELVLALGDGGGGFDDVVDKLFGLVDLVFGVGHDQAMEILLLVASVSSVGTAFTLLDRTFATDCNLCTGLRFHLLESVTTGTYEQTNFKKGEAKC